MWTCKFGLKDRPAGCNIYLYFQKQRKTIIDISEQSSYARFKF